MNACNIIVRPNLSPTVYSTNTPLNVAAPPLINTSNKSTLHCSLYTETRWGNGAGEWGDPNQLIGQTHDFFPPPAFDKQGALYISDFPNHRLLKYDNKNLQPVEIDIPESYFHNPNSQPFQEPWAAIEITTDNILIPYGLNKLGILRLDGTEEKVVELPYNYSLIASPWTLIRIDEQGGLIINGEKHAYFDVGWKEGKWIEISSRPAPQIGLFTWNDYIGYEGMGGSVILLYKIDTVTDIFNAPVTIELPLSDSAHIIGVDTIGRIYLRQWGKIVPTYIQYSVSSRQTQIGVINDVHPTQIIQSGVAPNGEIYLIVYDRQDVSVQPKIIRCRFPESE